MICARRVGLLPGSFNPPHRGHVELAAKACAAARLDHVVFYVNSFNAEKQHLLVDAEHRHAMLGLTIGPSRMSIVPPEFYPDRPPGLQPPSFVPLIDRLAAAIGGACEIWLVRGSDYFDPVLAPYPADLCHRPHVIGLREPSHAGFDFSMLAQVVIVATPLVSSQAVRRNLMHAGASGSIDAAVLAYMRTHRLFGSLPEAVA